eukprot:3252864-Pyramimonas_sp.AAC.1
MLRSLAFSVLNTIARQPQRQRPLGSPRDGPKGPKRGRDRLQDDLTRGPKTHRRQTAQRPTGDSHAAPQRLQGGPRKKLPRDPKRNAKGLGCTTQAGHPLGQCFAISPSRS